MESSRPDWQLCDKCDCPYRLGADSTAFLFAQEPIYDYIDAVCPHCRSAKPLWGFDAEFIGTLHSSVQIRRQATASPEERRQALSGIDIQRGNTAPTARTERLKKLEKMVQSLILRQED